MTNYASKTLHIETHYAGYFLYRSFVMDNTNSCAVACPQCGYKGAPTLKIRNNEFLIKCPCCEWTVHTTMVIADLIKIWNEEAKKYANK